MRFPLINAPISIGLACSLNAAPPAVQADNLAAQKLVEQLYGETGNPKAESLPPTVKKLIALGEAVVPVLEQGMDSANDYVSGGCAAALERIGGTAIDVFLRKMEAESPRMKMKGLLGIAYVSYRTGAEALKVRAALMPLVHDKDPETRRWALYGLQTFRERESVELIVEALEDPSLMIRREAALLLRATGDDFAGPALMKTLESDDSELRSNAVSALGFRHRDPRAFQALMRHRKDPSPLVRWRIVNVIANFGGKRAMKYLAEFLDDSESCGYGSPAEAAATIIGGMTGRTLNHSKQSVEEIQGWWKATGTAIYGGLEIPEDCRGYVSPFIPLRIMPEGWEFHFAEACSAPPGWTSSGAGDPDALGGPCRHYRFWQPRTPSPEKTAPYFDLYLVPLGWSGVCHSGKVRIEKGKVAPGASGNPLEVADAPEGRLMGKSSHDLVFWYSDKLGDWGKAPEDFAAYLKVNKQ